MSMANSRAAFFFEISIMTDAGATISKTFGMRCSIDERRLGLAFRAAAGTVGVGTTSGCPANDY